ncbi:type II toxin-antitoxin system RelE/ParE family toxin [Vannielia litorea]|uniref:type II toxin-antitoxin system RelE/ParE family toxin n=1 Tax=Vannielia litorea TaxID=1217970 RepID=UPI001BCAC206|nr:type II toxin-antitoxin system RelE/ParE family toxin [Vannielia litorea]MBS8227792.1 type II toxin-antitoxin system RelE/ParE family toxin [Vannielia litorea]
MAKWRLHEDAEADLLAIFDYSADTWGEARAEAYIESLVSRFNRLKVLPFRDVSDIADGLRSTRAERHVVFWLLQREEPPEIIAVLHERMDVLHHLRNRLGPAPE